MILRQFLHQDPVAISYLFGCGGKALCAVVDPVGDIRPYLRTADELKERAATLFMEDVGRLEWWRGDKISRTRIDVVQSNMGKAMLQIGENQQVRYKELFISAKSTRVEKGETGNALVAVAYLKLARDAIPGKSEELKELTMEEWKDEVSRNFLDNAPESRNVGNRQKG